ncbi:hypothetical protein POM88_035277 [Heracleum sosnowskyi]|uniref:Uncharacterized protein n=1 Tax=Heracleum sosnowskyi TaxID=360622 RepID=A0AAD8HKY0_9APIA|nr:hypothetical protein POM88_035277 [Heracleum sosnowskyi]
MAELCIWFYDWTCEAALCIPHDKFRNTVSEVINMGFDLESSYFCKAVRTLCYVTDSESVTRLGNLKVCCVEALVSLIMRSFPVSMFKKLPQIMSFSVDNINEIMEFFLNKLRLSRYPVILDYSLKKRTIPRCLVLQVLVSISD